MLLESHDKKVTPNARSVGQQEVPGFDVLNLEHLYKGVFIDCYTKFVTDQLSWSTDTDGIGSHK